MTATATEDLARVTVISPSRRIDVALPGSTSLAECLPTIVKFSGYEATSPAETVHAWVLQRLGEDPLDTNKRISALGLRDGETLHLREREHTMPDAAFDDVVDAVTTATTTRPSWSPSQSQWVGVIVMCLTLVGTPLLLLARSDPRPFGAVLETGITLFLSFTAGIGAIVLSRALGRYLPAVGLSWSAVLLAAAGGAFIAPGSGWPLRILLASTVTVITAGTMWLAARVQPYAHLAVTISAGVVLLSTMVMVLLNGYAAEVAAVAAALILALTSVLPTLSYKAARIAMPSLPANGEALMADDQPVQPDIVSRALTADRLLGAFLGATGLSTAALMVPILWSKTWIALALCLAVSVTLLLRARAFVGRAQRTSLLVSGLVLSLSTLALILIVTEPLARLLIASPIAIVVTVALATYSAALYNRTISPVWGRFGDILEWLSIMAIVPLVLGVVDVYAMVLAKASGG